MIFVASVMGQRALCILCIEQQLPAAFWHVAVLKCLRQAIACNSTRTALALF